MIFLPEEILDRYLKELTEYYTWTLIKKIEYGDNAHPFAGYSNTDYEKVRNTNVSISAIEKVLGLSDEEITRYNDEAKEIARRVDLSDLNPKRRVLMRNFTEQDVKVLNSNWIDPEKPFLLFVHGNWADIRTWFYTAKNLKAHGYAFNLISMPDRGKPEVGNRSFDDYVDTVKEASLKIRNSTGKWPVLIGHSLGAISVIKAAEAGYASAAILVAPCPVSNFPAPVFTSANIRLFLPWLLKGMLKFRFSTPYKPSLSAVRCLFVGWSDAEIQKQHESMHIDSGRVIKEIALKSKSTIVDPSAVKCPIYCISASDDLASPPGVVKNYASWLSARYDEVPGSHFVMIQPEHMQFVPDKVHTFLEETFAAKKVELTSAS